MKRFVVPTVSLVFTAAILAGCTTKKPVTAISPPPPPQAPTCTPSRLDHPMIGAWYAVSQPKGMSGDLRTLTVLAADGSMTYETQLKIGRKIRPGLRESGCWSMIDDIYTMQTTKSNGELVEFDDPIYSNRYKVEKLDGARLVLKELKAGAKAVTAKRVKIDYRLPY